MMHKLSLILALAIFSVMTLPLSAGEPAEQTKMVIALNTDDFELAETDISDLAIGDSETIVTESGKTIDLLRTGEGVEIYVDGELLDAGLDGEEGLHEGHAVVHKKFEIICDAGEECEEMVWISDGDGADLEYGYGEGHHERIIVIEEEVEIN